jgi:hypothetical protein
MSVKPARLKMEPFPAFREAAAERPEIAPEGPWRSAK